jgi:hypothetical protein
MSEDRRTSSRQRSLRLLLLAVTLAACGDAGPEMALLGTWDSPVVETQRYQMIPGADRTFHTDTLILAADGLFTAIAHLAEWGTGDTVVEDRFITTPIESGRRWGYWRVVGDSVVLAPDTVHMQYWLMLRIVDDSTLYSNVDGWVAEVVDSLYPGGYRVFRRRR